MEKLSNAVPRLGELITLRELQGKLSAIFPSQGSLDWMVRQHRAELIEAGAIYEVAGRLLAHPATFENAALAIGLRTLADRHQVKGTL